MRRVIKAVLVSGAALLALVVVKLALLVGLAYAIYAIVSRLHA
jgi:hypothetical protein